MNPWGIPSLRKDRLATLAPTCTYAGGKVEDAARTLFIWRTCSFPQDAQGGVLGFFVDDYRFACLWNRPELYAARFAAFGWGAVIEPDFSTWRDAPLVEQLWAVYRMRTLGRLYQEHEIPLIPNLAWSDERSFAFCFQGIPSGVPVVACEARTPGQNDRDRRAFLTGLAEGVRQVEPESIIIYGGVEHAFWLASLLPHGPQYRLLPSFMTVRTPLRRAEKRRQQQRNQLHLFTGGTLWADEEQAAEAAAVD